MPSRYCLAVLLAAARITTIASCVTVDAPPQEQVVTTVGSAALPTTLVPLLAGSHVTTEQGTGFVHIAPGHGVEDYELAHLQHDIAVPETVGEDGYILPHLPLYGGMHVLRDNASC